MSYTKVQRYVFLLTFVHHLHVCEQLLSVHTHALFIRYIDSQYCLSGMK